MVAIWLIGSLLSLKAKPEVRRTRQLIIHRSIVFSVFFCLYSVGVNPVCFLNAVLNDDLELNPTSYKISKTVYSFRSVEASNSIAFSILDSLTKLVLIKFFSWCFSLLILMNGAMPREVLCFYPVLFCSDYCFVE